MREPRTGAIGRNLPLDRRSRWSTLLFGHPQVPPGARLAPSPPGDPVLGHLRAVRSQPLTFFLRARQRFGDVVRLHFGAVTAHLISNPEHVRHVLQERHRLYTKDTRGYRMLRLLLGDGLLTSEGALWLRQRRIAQPAFHRERIEGFGRLMVRAAKDTAEGWRTAATRGEPVDVHAEMMRLTLRVVAETLLGSSVERDADTVSRALAYLLADVNDRIRAVVDVPLRLPLPANVRAKKHMEALDGIVRRVIEERHREPTDRIDLLQMLVEARDAETGERMSDDQLRDEVMTIFLAGHETTANALSWTFYLLSKAPDVLTRLESEVDGVLGGREPEVGDLPHLPFAKQVLEESLRLYPPAWALGRSPSEDDEVGGFLIPGRSLVFVSPWVTHRHPDVWTDPEGFDPDRFAPERRSMLPRFAYFPFGGGPRLCIGTSFALVEAQLVLARVVQQWRLELVGGVEVEPEPLITLRPRGGLPMYVRPRHR